MDHTSAVQIKRPNRRPTRRSQADEIKMIGTPGEMPMPIIMPWVKEQNLTTRCRIDRMRLIGFGAIASLTGEGQIVFVVRAAFTIRLDMLNGMQLRGVEFGADAVFAIALRALSNQTAQFGGKAFLTHAARV
jgi:hypothetical protein